MGVENLDSGAYGAGNLAIQAYTSTGRCLVRRNSGGDAIRGVVLHVVSATYHGSRRALAICVGPGLRPYA